MPLLEEQEKRLRLREQVSEHNKMLAQAASEAGVLPHSFGIFQNAGYKGQPETETDQTPQDALW